MKIYLITLLVMFFSFGLSAQTVLVEKVQGPDLTDGEKFSLKELIEAEVSKVDGYYVVPTDGKINLKPSALKLGGTSFLKLSVSGEGLKTRSVKMKTENFQDIDRVVNRLVTAALNDEEVAETATIENITESETNNFSVRYNARKQWMFGFGPTTLANSGTSESGYYFNFGYNWQLDPNWAMQLNYDFSVIENSPADFGMLAIGVNRYFSGASASPYVGLEFGYASADAHNCEETIFDLCTATDSASGWAGSVKAGMQFFRTSSVNLGIETKYSHLFSKHSEGQPGRFVLSLTAFY